MSSFSIYVIGFVIFVAGVAYAATLIGAPPLWIGVGVVILLGIGIMSAVSRTKRPDPPAT
jgi:hypothetical protein